MGRVVHFEISADDPQRAADFYSSVFGWKFDKWNGPMEYWLVTTGSNQEPGINGGMFTRKDGPIGHVNTIDVDDLDAHIEKIIAAGGQVAMAKMAVPGIGWLAYGADTEGSLFGMMQRDAAAA